MNLAEKIEDIFTSYLEKFELAWWIEIVTVKPACTYYFGPFMSEKEAQEHQGGYVEDLEAEEAEGITIHIRQCQPQTLTIFEDE